MSPSSSESLQAWRERLIHAVLLGAALLATPVVVFGSINQFESGFPLLIPLYLLLYGLLVTFALFKSIGYLPRASLIVAVFYVVGATEFWTGGLIGDGKIFFFGCIVLSGLLFGKTGGLAATTLCMLTGLLAAYRHLYGDAPENPAFGTVSSKGINWVTALLNLLFISGTVTISVSYLIRRIETSRIAAVTLAEQLQDEIAERKSAQAELASYQENLEGLVAERTAELRETRAALHTQESLVALGRLTTALSHELRTPLGTIHSSAFFLTRHLSDTDEPVQRALDRISRNVKRCDHIIEELVMFGRDEALQKESIELDAWLRDFVDGLDITGLPHIDQQLNAPGHYRFDETQLRWCIRNLISNACDALAESSPANGASPRIALRSEHREDTISIRITDNGPGIGEKDLPHIFEPLFSTKGIGAGLGLPIARKLARIHGGDIAVLSATPGNTTLEIHFPAESE